MFWLAAAFSGFLLSAADYPLHAWTMGLFALTPFLVALQRPGASTGARRVAGGGVLFGAAYAVPLAIALGFPFTLALGEVLLVIAGWVIVWIGAARALRLGPVAGPLVAAAFVALLEWANMTFVPIWGTAQSFVRSFSASPLFVQVVALGGMSALVFVVFAAQALMASAIVRGSRRLMAGTTALLAVGFGLSWWWVQGDRAARQGGEQVAAIGWRSTSQESNDQVLDELIEPNVHQAAQRGATLVVTPEAGLVVGHADRAAVLERLSRLARTEHVRLAIGWFDADAQSNHVTLFDADGRASEPYTKTHLVPFVERYPAGDGTLVTSGDVGTMICQDDNFTDLARGYGRRATPIVAVPTNDWREVAPFHLENSIFRAVENRYVVVRAARNGTSAIISPAGDVLAKLDSFVDGDGLIVARVPRPDPGAWRLYSRFDAAPFVWGALLAYGVWRARRERQVRA